MLVSISLSSFPLRKNVWRYALFFLSNICIDPKIMSTKGKTCIFGSGGKMEWNQYKLEFTVQVYWSLSVWLTRINDTIYNYPSCLVYLTVTEEIRDPGGGWEAVLVSCRWCDVLYRNRHQDIRWSRASPLMANFKGTYFSSTKNQFYIICTTSRFT